MKKNVNRSGSDRNVGGLKGLYVNVTNLSFRTHIFISITFRLLLIFYGEFQDAHSEVPYTDIDYKVVTDGARQILAGCSPFDRHTYRYSPVLAYMQLPNVIVHAAFGKIIYACFDIFVAMLIYALTHSTLQHQLKQHVHAKSQADGKDIDATMQCDKLVRNARLAACFWLYNPLTAVISTRGNGDSVSSFFVVLTLYLLTKANSSQNCKNRFVLFAGLAHGFAIHLRLYPLLFSLSYFLCLSQRFAHNIKDFLRQIVFPNLQQWLLMLGTAIGLFVITGSFYLLYGWQYIYEAYLYHVVRKDSRHNFSLYFLMQYLGGAGVDVNVFEKLLIAIKPQFIVLTCLSFRFGQFYQTLPFCVFCLTFVMVTFNSVVTSQYFVWYLALLPLCLHNFQQISIKNATGCFSLWLLAQGLWLLPAYLLEFKTWNCFLWIGAQCALFFIANIFILVRLVNTYNVLFDPF